jgi:MFS family permease
VRLRFAESCACPPGILLRGCGGLSPVDRGRATEPPSGAGRYLLVSALGLTQILAWGSSYYLPAVLAAPIAAETGWPLSFVVGGLSVGLVVAGLVSPRVGRAIQERSGRPVLAASSLLLGFGLATIGLAPTLSVYLAGWLIVGAGMGAGLYDAAFASLGRLFGQDARRSIVALTLFGGFASTVCWPLSAFLLAELGWRGACLVYAAIQLCFALPLHFLVFPRAVPTAASEQPDVRHSSPRLLSRDELRRFVVLATAIALASAISGTVAVHLLTLLQAKGMALAGAVALGALVGPAQVSARVVEMLFGRHYHPIWTKLAATSLVATGLALLLAGFPILAIALMLYGCGVGIESIARGTLPLALFGPQNYAALIGRIAFPSNIAQAVSPALAAILVQRSGADAMLPVLTAFACLNVGLTIVLWLMCRRRTLAQ